MHSDRKVKKLMDEIDRLKAELTLYQSGDVIAENKKLKSNESEELYKMIADVSDDLIAITTFSLKAVYTYVSPSHCRKLGYTVEDLLGKSGFDFIHPDDRSKLLVLLKSYVQKKISKLIHGREKDIVEKIEYRIKDKDNNWRELESIVKIIKEDKILFFSRDITDRKDTERETIRAQKDWEDVFRSIAHPTIILDKNFEILTANDATINLTGKSAEELIGQKCFEVFHTADSHESESGCPMQKILDNVENGPVEIEMQALGKVFQVSCTPIFDKNNLLEKIIHISMDITEIKQFESIIKENEENYSQLIEQLPDGIAIHKEGKIIFANQAGAEILGMKSKEELVGYEMSKLMLPENLEISAERIKRLIEGEKDVYPLEDKYVRIDGEVIDVEVHASVIEYEGDTAFQVVVRDISDRIKARKELQDYRSNLEELVKKRTVELEHQAKRLSDSQKALTFLLEDSNDTRLELEKANLSLKSLNKELESFSYSVSHDLRAPLTRMDGFSKALAEDYTEILDENGQHYLNRIRASSQHMASLIDDLLNLSRITRQQVVKIDVDLSKIVKQVSNEINEVNPDYKVKIKIESGLIVKADRRLIKVMLTNLIGNAMKFSSKEKAARIEVGKILKDKKEAIYIKDNGVGFDMKYHNQIFNPFNRLHSDKEYVGSGVGLAIVQRVINKHGGRIWAESEEGVGSTFYFQI